MSNITPNHPPYPAFRATNKESFAYETTIRRWPIIIDSAITDVKQTIAETTTERAQEGANIVVALEEIKQEIIDEKPLRPIQDNRPDAAKWNKHLEDYFKGCTWMNGTWLFNECYMYRRIAEIFYNSQHWTDYDCFERQKNDTFKGSHGAVFDLARKMSELIKPMPEEKLEIVYNELVQVCLWGNATDLSLLTNMSQEDIERLQAVEKDHLAKRRQFILVDDTEKLWQKIKSLKGGRVDFVLDNSGFEVFVDMIFADWLLQSGIAGKVVFHCKTMPWFVSDVMPKDMPMMFKNCLDKDFFPFSQKRSQQDVGALETMVHRWEQYVADGKLEVRSHDFWCTGLSYWFMESDAPDLFNEMKGSDIVLYKGDLNYRKLIFDCDFPVTTSFKEAVGPSMANNFTNIIALRTNKADPVVGLSEETKKDIESRATRQEWRFSGKYAVVQYN